MAILSREEINKILDEGDVHKIEGIVHDPETQRRIEEQRQARIDAMNPETRAKWDAYQARKKQAMIDEPARMKDEHGGIKNPNIEEEPEVRAQRIRERIRAKLVVQMYDVMDLDPDYFERKTAEINDARKKAGIVDRNTLNKKQLFESNMDIANGAAGAVKADKRGKRHNFWDRISETIKAGVSVAGAGGIAKIVAEIGLATGEVAAGIGLGVSVGFTLLPAALAWIMYKVKKGRNAVSLQGNKEDTADKYTTAEDSLKDLKNQVEIIQKSLESHIDELAEKYDKMKPEDFEKEVKKVVAAELSKAGYGLEAYTDELTQMVKDGAEGKTSGGSEKPKPETKAVTKAELDAAKEDGLETQTDESKRTAEENARRKTEEEMKRQQEQKQIDVVLGD